MNVLVACEESQAVCKAFREKGHRAFSCDIQECSGGHPEWHILGDCIPLLNGNCEFTLQDGTIDRQTDRQMGFDNSSSTMHLSNRYGDKAIQRHKDREEAAQFFMEFVNADSDKVVIENPIGCMSKRYKKPTQIIQPYMFGDPVRKPTCLWIKGLNPLEATDVVEPEIINDGRSTYSGAAYYAKDENGKILSWNDPRTAKARSKTFPGIAKAMADQWG